ncbi:Uncharacterised protein [Citrobacter freundii]|nr:Uncharacterised protein [Citrobacter freundii]
MSELNGCDINKSYQWNRDHGFIENGNSQQSRHHRHGDEQQNSADRDNAGIYGKFSGNYVAKFSNGQRSVDIHVEGSSVYVNGNEVRDVNTYQDTMTFRVGYATYTIKTNGRGSWNGQRCRECGQNCARITDIATMKKLISTLVIMASLSGCAEHPYLSAAAAGIGPQQLPRRSLITKTVKPTVIKSMNARSTSKGRTSMRGGIVTITPMMTAMTITTKSPQRALRSQRSQRSCITVCRFNTGVRHGINPHGIA